MTAMSTLSLLLVTLPSVLSCSAGDSEFTWHRRSDGSYSLTTPASLGPSVGQRFESDQAGDVLYLTRGTLEAMVNLRSGEVVMTGGWQLLTGSCAVRGASPVVEEQG